MTPDEFTNQEFFLDVGDGHRLYVHDWGNAKAKPIFYLHGGPGVGCDNRDKQKFNPSSQRVIFHDQRGSGQSTPTGSLKNNTIQDLIKDIDKIADHLGIKQFIITGGSWGSTLALAYAIDQPKKVTGLVIDGVFTASQEENDWFEQGGWQEFFPDAWEAYQQTVPAKFQSSPSAYHYHQALNGTPQEVKRSSYDYTKMEIAILKLDDQYQAKPYDEYEPGHGLIEMHYLAHKCFLPDKHIFKNVSQLTMPVYIIQGRYDMVTRPSVAYRLSQALPNCQLIWTINGHAKQHEAKNILMLVLERLAGGR